MTPRRQMLEFPAEKLIGTSVFNVGAAYRDEPGAEL